MVCVASDRCTGVLDGVSFLRRRGLGAVGEDVHAQGRHDGDSDPHGLLPTIDEGLLRGVDQRLPARPDPVSRLDSVRDALAGGLRCRWGDTGEPAARRLHRPATPTAPVAATS